ncbi:MAG: hypothetical protein ICV68_02280 [Pyrinomonadaceae bacterium]|nr:hypothetical protein [Pyrinomonadaceae bacterium]
MTKIDAQELVTITQAAQERGVTRQWIDSLLRRGKIETIEIAGKRFVRLQDVLNYEPELGGRPPKLIATNKKDDKKIRK